MSRRLWLQNPWETFLVICLLGLVSALGTACRATPPKKPRARSLDAVRNSEFYISACVDFYDDAIKGPYTPELIEQMMKTLKEMGVKRVYWIHYGDATYEMLWKERGLKSLKDSEHLKMWDDLPEEVSTWVQTHGITPGDKLVQDCQKAIARIRDDDDSELKELWEEDQDSLAEWHAVLDDLLARLQ